MSAQHWWLCGVAYLAVGMVWAAKDAADGYQRFFNPAFSWYFHIIYAIVALLVWLANSFTWPMYLVVKVENGEWRWRWRK